MYLYSTNRLENGTYKRDTLEFGRWYVFCKKTYPIHIKVISEFDIQGLIKCTYNWYQYHMVLKTEKYICSFDIEMYLVGSWFSTEKSIYINRAIALFINGKM